MRYYIRINQQEDINCPSKTHAIMTGKLVKEKNPTKIVELYCDNKLLVEFPENYEPLQENTEITLKELEERMLLEDKSGYVEVQMPTRNGYDSYRNLRIEYFKDCADWHHINYKTTKIKFIRYVGWDK
jgi:hypothetical protein